MIKFLLDFFFFKFDYLKEFHDKLEKWKIQNVQAKMCNKEIGVW